MPARAKVDVCLLKMLRNAAGPKILKSRASNPDIAPAEDHGQRYVPTQMGKLEELLKENNGGKNSQEMESLLAIS
jgi:hypothetical protein